MIWLYVVVGVTGWAVALAVLLLVPARTRREALQLSLRLRSNLRPYMVRRAVDAGIDVPEPPDPHVPRVIVDDLCEIARRLTTHERSQMETGDTVNMATSDTMPVDTGDLSEAEKKQD